MKCYIIDTLSGLFAVDESGTLINFLDFNDNEQNIVEFYISLDEGEIIGDINNLFSELTHTGFNEFIFDNKQFKNVIDQKKHYTSHLEINSLEFRNFRFNLESQLQNVGISKTKDEILLKHKKVSQDLIKLQISKAGQQGDVAIIQAIETLNTLKKSISLFSVRLREWYGIHFPELTDKVIEDNIILAKLVSTLGHRDNYTLERLGENFDLSSKRIDFLIENASSSMGADIDLTMVKNYANQIIMLDSYREELEEYLEKLMEDVAPNLMSIIGSLIGAKLITKAGSLKKLAFMPASRIQLLGAETALYRFLRTGKGIPKHGLIFQWNQIRGSKAYLRGKISRIVSGKIGIAAKVDYFRGDFIGEDISKDLSNKIKEIENKYPNPPKKIKKTMPSNKSVKKQKKRGKRGK
ncbi:MAG: hypothetical protein ACFFBP_02285 [Promethearchaeota archaeon]